MSSDEAVFTARRIRRDGAADVSPARSAGEVDIEAFVRRDAVEQEDRRLQLVETEKQLKLKLEESTTRVAKLQNERAQQKKQLEHDQSTELNSTKATLSQEVSDAQETCAAEQRLWLASKRRCCSGHRRVCSKGN